MFRSDALLQCIGGAAYLWMLSPRMALACLGVSVALWTVALFYGSFTRRAQRIYQDALADSNSAAGARGAGVRAGGVGWRGWVGGWQLGVRGNGVLLPNRVRDCAKYREGQRHALQVG